MNSPRLWKRAEGGVRRENSRRGIPFQRPELPARRISGPRGRLASCVLAVLALCGAGSGAASDTLSSADSLRLIPVGRFDFVATDNPDVSLLPEGLSAIAWQGDDHYLAVGDEHACLHRLTVQVDPKTGRVLGAKFGAPVRLTDSLGVPIPDIISGKDREGLALEPATESVWIANEWTGADVHHPSVAKHDIKTGRMLALVRTDSDSLLQVFGRIRYNLGFESLTRKFDGSGYWTANEGPLLVDSRRVTDSTGAVVRLLSFDGAMHPAAQYAYRIDSFSRRISSPFFLAGSEVNGLSELAALPDGRLLALERAFAGDSTGAANFRDRIYLVDTAGATDVSRGDLAGGLNERTYTPARKTMLWEMNSGFTNSNFEGMTLAGRLDDGAQLLLLIADNDKGRSQALYSLRLVGLK